MIERKYVPTIADLIDRLSICLMKSIYIDRDVYRSEICLIVEDLENLLGAPSDAYKWCEAVYPILVLMLSNRVIWENESKARAGGDEQDKFLKFTHSINGLRSQAKNRINNIFDERVDGKVDCLAADLPEEFGNWNVFGD